MAKSAYGPPLSRGLQGIWHFFAHISSSRRRIDLKIVAIDSEWPILPGLTTFG